MMIAAIGKEVLSKALTNNIYSSMSAITIKKKKKFDGPDGEKKRLDDNQQLLLDKFKARKTTRFAQTKEGYRIDVGLVLNRPAIFFNLKEYELERMKVRTAFQKKYKRNIEIPDDLKDFNFKDPQMEAEETNLDNFATHFVDLGAGEKIEYCESSKYYRKVDPNVTDQRSLQYAPCHRTYMLMRDQVTQEYAFPTRSVLDRELLNEAKLILWEKLTGLKFTAHHGSVVPNFVQTREFTKEELGNPLHRSLKGVKTFYFISTHVQGVPYINPEVTTDYIWVPKRHFQNHVKKEYYDDFINGLHDI